MAATPTTVPSSINANDHGPYVVFVGAILLSATVLMFIIASYNRLSANTLYKADSPLLVLGGILNVLFFALFAVAVQHGLGQHTSALPAGRLSYLERLYLGNLLVFLLSQGLVKIAYNLLARRTARELRFQRVMDGFSVLIGIWTLVAVIIMAIAVAKSKAPSVSWYMASFGHADRANVYKKAYFLTTGAVSIAIVIGQLTAFLWIVWRTKAKTKTKLRWTFSIGAFVPLCVIAIICRLAYQPTELFGGDWTFDGVLNIMLFLIELNFIFLTVLAPNLPFFFEKTSTGGLHFQPGNTTSSISGGTASVSKLNSYALSSGLRRPKGDVERYGGKSDMVATVQCSDNSKKRASFDSDVILVRRSVEIERESTEAVSSDYVSSR